MTKICEILLPFIDLNCSLNVIVMSQAEITWESFPLNHAQQMFLAWTWWIMMVSWFINKFYFYIEM